MSATLSFPAADIKIEGIAIDVTLTPAWLAHVLRDTEVEPRGEDAPAGRLRARLSRSGHDIVVRGTLTAEVEVPCARCLEPAPISVHTELSLLLQPMPRAELRARRQPTELEREFSPAEAELDVYDGEVVVLDDFVREAILLEVPQFPLCQESCPGIAHLVEEPAPEETFDPRLAPLGAFLKPAGGAVTVDDLVAAARERSASMGRKPLLRANQGPRPRKRKR
jgi:uncharacterized protein